MLGSTYEGAPRPWPEAAQHGRRVERARPDLGVVRLHDDAASAGPVGLEFSDHVLEGQGCHGSPMLIGDRRRLPIPLRVQGPRPRPRSPRRGNAGAAVAVAVNDEPPGRCSRFEPDGRTPGPQADPVAEDSRPRARGRVRRQRSRIASEVAGSGSRSADPAWAVPPSTTVSSRGTMYVSVSSSDWSSSRCAEAGRTLDDDTTWPLIGKTLSSPVSFRTEPRAIDDDGLRCERPRPVGPPGLR